MIYNCWLTDQGYQLVGRKQDYTIKLILVNSLATDNCLSCKFWDALRLGLNVEKLLGGSARLMRFVGFAAFHIHSAACLPDDLSLHMLIWARNFTISMEKHAQRNKSWVPWFLALDLFAADARLTQPKTSLFGYHFSRMPFPEEILSRFRPGDMPIKV